MSRTHTTGYTNPWGSTDHQFGTADLENETHKTIHVKTRVYQSIKAKMSAGQAVLESISEAKSSLKHMVETYQIIEKQQTKHVRPLKVHRVQGRDMTRTTSF